MTSIKTKSNRPIFVVFRSQKNAWHEPGKKEIYKSYHVPRTAPTVLFLFAANTETKRNDKQNKKYSIIIIPPRA
jgi:hypothetical protein